MSDIKMAHRMPGWYKDMFQGFQQTVEELFPDSAATDTAGTTAAATAAAGTAGTAAAGTAGTAVAGTGGTYILVVYKTIH